ncbi:MAG: hypothetical protein A4E52_02205 [Pelotomaculum sp. PtaB.Bin013]|nr:MAG: hypothetical protein A4E52_02205 [Pelotomaculum sp. PtaB.Bin013]
MYRADDPTNPGKDFTVKSKVYEQLTLGQRALLMFWVLYGHAHSTAEFYWFVSYYISELKVWPEIKSGIQYFGDDAMYRIYKEIEGVVKARNQEIRGKRRKDTVIDLDDNSELFATVDRLYKLYPKIAPETIKRISTYIRNNPDEFVLLED